jgi:hypothetical protein
LHQAIDIFLEDLLVADRLLQVTVILLDLHQIGECLRVDKLAALAVRALEVVMILLAQFSLVSRGDMLLLLELVLSMSEGTRLTILAFLVLDPALAKFCLDLKLVVVGYNSTVTSECEWRARAPEEEACPLEIQD